MNANGSKLTRKQESAIAALLTAPTIEAAAVVVGVGEVTLWRWMKLPEVQEAYRAARHEVVSQAIARLQRACSKAVDTLEEIMADQGAKDSARVNAAKAVLELSLKAGESEELVARVETLEEALNQRRER